MTCPNCRLENPPGAERCDCGYEFATGKTVARKAAGSRWPLVSGGYALGWLALFAPWLMILPLHAVPPLSTSFLPFLLPAALGLAALACGVANLVEGKRNHGFAQIAIALICGVTGTLAGFTMGTGFDR